MDVDALLGTRDLTLKSGEDLEYDPLFTDLELAAKPGEERQEGDKILPAEDPDWRIVVDKSVAVLELSHDLRAAVFYAEAILYSDGLKGLEAATRYIRGCLEDYWDSCHPQLDEDDGDATMRINAVQGLGADQHVVRAVRRCGLTNSRMFGQKSLRDMEIADGTIGVPDDVEDVPDSSSINAAIQDTDPDDMADILKSAKSIRENIKAIDAVFSEHTPGEGPSLEPLDATLASIVRRLSDATGSDVSDQADDDGDDVVAGGAPQGGGGAPISGAVNSQADVLAALDKIISYYERSEPSSPVPILLERAKKLVGADFLSIMGDMAPDGLNNVRLIGGIEEEY